jgi:hypothetical protein
MIQVHCEANSSPSSRDIINMAAALFIAVLSAGNVTREVLYKAGSSQNLHPVEGCSPPLHENKTQYKASLFEQGRGMVRETSCDMLTCQKQRFILTVTTRFSRRPRVPQ